MLIYLAGPDIFFPDATMHAAIARCLCKHYGYDALLASDIDFTDPKKIHEARLAMIRRSQIVIANLDPFRGAEPESGTCFELGFAAALGKKVVGYVSVIKTTRERVCDVEGRRIPGSPPLDKSGCVIEDYELPVNLMLACSMDVIEGGLEACLKHLKRRVLAPGPVTVVEHG